MRTAIRALDNVIDINYYSVPQARTSNFRHRPVGLGIMGFQDALYKQKLAYGSDAAVEFADRSMEAVSYYAIQASSKLDLFSLLCISSIATPGSDNISGNPLLLSVSSNADSEILINFASLNTAGEPNAS